MIAGEKNNLYKILIFFISDVFNTTNISQLLSFSIFNQPFFMHFICLYTYILYRLYMLYLYTSYTCLDSYTYTFLYFFILN